MAFNDGKIGCYQTGRASSELTSKLERFFADGPVSVAAKAGEGASRKRTDGKSVFAAPELRRATRLVTGLRASVMDEDEAVSETATRQKAFKS